MNIYKVLNIPNKKQKNKINNDIQLIWNKCNKISQTENREQKEAKQFHDNTCPNCKSKKNIVNKISYIQTTTKTVAAIKFGFGTIETVNNFNTTEVNHCNECGNEWIKFKVKIATSDKILNVIFNYLSQILKNPQEREHEWKMEAISIFNNCYAESIYNLRIKQKNYLYEKTNDCLTLNRLRKYYKSVYD
jgi:hypothetical protein